MKLRKALIVGGVSLTLATGLIGFAHTKAGRPIMALFGGGCPMSLDHADPAKVESYRVAQLKAHAGEKPAASHPALGFELGKTHKADVLAWAAERRASCHEKREGSVLSCLNVVGEKTDSGCAPALTDVHLQFDRAGTLVAVDLFRTTPSAASAVEHVTTKSRELDQRVGPANHTTGELDASFLEAAPWRRAAREYRYSDYLAKLSVTHFPGSGMRVREQYQWIPITG